MRTRAALFFTMVFPLVWLFVYEGLFAHGNPRMIMYLFGPVVTLNIMGSAFWGLGLQTVMQRERGILRRFRLAPINSLSLVGANLLANYLLQLPVIGLLVFTAKVIFHMPLAFNLGALFVLVTVGTFGFAGFGLTIGSIANTMQEAQIYNNLIWLTLLFLSGATIPLPMLPGWIQRFATFLPATYLVTSFQAIMIRGESLIGHAPEMMALALSGVFGMLFAWKLFRWEKEEKISNRAKAWSLVFIFPFVLIGFWMNLYANPTKAWASTYSMLSTGLSDAQHGGSSDTIGVLVEDFESQLAVAELAKRWNISATPGTDQAVAKLELISPGADATIQAVRIKRILKSAIPAGQEILLVSYKPPDPNMMSKIISLQFMVRGDGHKYKFQLVRFGSLADGPETTLVPYPDWQRIALPWPVESATEISTRASPWLLQISVAGQPGEYNLDVDQIGYVGIKETEGKELTHAAPSSSSK